MKPWEVVRHPGGIDVKPEDDIVTHKDGPDCSCAPKVNLEGHSCGSYGKPVLHVRTVTVHNAMDGRPN